MAQERKGVKSEGTKELPVSKEHSSDQSGGQVGAQRAFEKEGYSDLLLLLQQDGNALWVLSTLGYRITFLVTK